jgi:hypothetical protein
MFAGRRSHPGCNAPSTQREVVPRPGGTHGEAVLRRGGDASYAFSRSNLRITLPVDVIGISGMKAISRGYSCAESRVLTKV